MGVIKRSQFCSECSAEIRSLNRPVVAPSAERVLTLAAHYKATGQLKCTCCIMAKWIGHCALVMRNEGHV